MQSRFLSCFLLVVVCVGAVDPLSLLLGWTGDGKTHFCNRFDTVYCGEEAKSMDSCTYKSFIGTRFVDVMGLGDNRGHNHDNKSATAEAFRMSLEAVRGRRLRAVIWIINCQANIFAEALTVVKQAQDLLGAVPFVAVFNTMGSSGCRNTFTRQGFMQKVAEHSIVVRDTYYIDEFDPEAFERRYKEAYRVILPSPKELASLIPDPVRMAADLKKIRELRCVEIPKLLANESEAITRISDRLLSVADPPVCSRTLCSADVPNLRSCTREVCVAHSGPTKVGIAGVFELSFGGGKCRSYEIRTDSTCERENAVLLESYQLNLEDCKEASKRAEEVCLENADRGRKQADAEREALRADIERHRAEQDKLLETQAVCDLAVRL